MGHNSLSIWILSCICSGLFGLVIGRWVFLKKANLQKSEMEDCIKESRSIMGLLHVELLVNMHMVQNQQLRMLVDKLLEARRLPILMASHDWTRDISLEVNILLQALEFVSFRYRAANSTIVSDANLRTWCTERREKLLKVSILVQSFDRFTEDKSFLISAHGIGQYIKVMVSETIREMREFDFFGVQRSQITTRTEYSLTKEFNKIMKGIDNLPKN
jgi:hypothetical protein